MHPYFHLGEYFYVVAQECLPQYRMWSMDNTNAVLQLT